MLTALLGDPEALDTMHRESRARFLQAYSWQSVLMDYEDLFVRVAADGAPQEPLATTARPVNVPDDRTPSAATFAQ